MAGVKLIPLLIFVYCISIGRCKNVYLQDSIRFFQNLETDDTGNVAEQENGVIGQEFKNRKTLTEALLNPKWYNPDVNPDVTSGPIVVNHTFAVTSIVGLKDEILHLQGWQVLTWYDKRLQWSPDISVGIKTLLIPDTKVWTPDILLYDSASDYKGYQYNLNVLVNHDGKVVFVPPVFEKVLCPFDEDVLYTNNKVFCEMKFGSWTYDGTMIDIQTATRGLDRKYLDPKITFGLHGYQKEWTEWKQKYGKIYSSAKEENYHMTIWKKNYKYVTEHNKRTDVQFQVELNHLADQLLHRPPLQLLQEARENLESSPDSNQDIVFVPSSWDWRQKGAIGPVQNQGPFGDVQTIVAAECVESYAFIKTGKLVDVSEYEIHDCCVKSPLFAANVFKCIHDIGGLCSTASYPRSLGTCGNNTCSSVIQIEGSAKVPSGNETAMMDAVYKMPVFALVDASHPSFQLYRSGIYSETACSATQVDHALQVVGYGSQNGQAYWICKNSWGISWGDRGYILIARNHHNMCGIASYSMYPV